MSSASKCPMYKYLPIQNLGYVQCPVLIHYSYHAGHMLCMPIYNLCLTQAAHPSAHHISTTFITHKCMMLYLLQLEWSMFYSVPTVSYC